MLEREPAGELSMRQAERSQERELAESFQVSRATVRQALQSLIEDGLIYSVRGQGTFVSQSRISKGLTLTSFSEDMRARDFEPATRLLAAALQRESCQEVAFVEAPVTPSNAASLALFRGLAAKLGTRCRETTCFPAHLFPAAGHEEERLLRIGPFDRADLARLTPTPE